MRETNRDKIWQEIEVELENTPLANLYADLLNLRKQEEFTEVAYEKFKVEFLQLANQLDDQDQLIIISQLVNHFHQQFRNGLKTSDAKIFELTKWQLKPNLFPTFRVLSKAWFLNQISNACTLKEFETAEEIKALHKDRIDEKERILTTLHADCIIHFHKDQYAAAYHLISKAINQYALDPHTDSVRLKCLRLMSTLCLVVKDYNEWEERYRLALTDFDVFFARKSNDIQEERFHYYRNMVIIIRKYHNNLVKRGDLNAVFSELDTSIKETQKLHGRSWLRSFLWHFNPEVTPTLPVKPFGNSGLSP